jgi:hypothetical protein
MTAFQLFLLLVGAFLAAFAIVALIVLLWIRQKIRKWTASIGAEMEKYAAAAPLVPPLRIQLEADDGLEWEHLEDIEEVSSALNRAGFQHAGDFDLEEHPIYLRAFTHTANHLDCVVYDHYQSGVWFEFVTHYKDGRQVTFTTAESSGLAPPTYATVEHHPDAEPQELLEHCLATRPPGEKLDTAASQFARRFTEAYAREMNWRVERGGPTEAEIRAAGIKHGEVDDEFVQHVRYMWRLQLNEYREEQLRTAFLDQAGLSARRWEEVRDRLVFVHDHLTEDDVLDQCEQLFPLDEDNLPQDNRETNVNDDENADDLVRERRRAEIRQKLRGLSPRKGFDRINQELDATNRIEKIGELTKPFPADVYLRSDVDH